MRAVSIFALIATMVEPVHADNPPYPNVHDGIEAVAIGANGVFDAIDLTLLAFSFTSAKRHDLGIAQIVVASPHLVLDGLVLYAQATAYDPSTGYAHSTAGKIYWGASTALATVTMIHGIYQATTSEPAGPVLAPAMVGDAAHHGVGLSLSSRF